MTGRPFSSDKRLSLGADFYSVGARGTHTLWISLSWSNPVRQFQARGVRGMQNPLSLDAERGPF